MMSNQFFDNNDAEKALIEAMKKSFQAENLQPDSEVKANLTTAFRQKHTSIVVRTLNKGIPTWQVAASFLLLLSVVYLIRPFEKTIVANNEPIIKTKEVIKEKIVFQTDTIVVEKNIIQYVERPETTRTVIENPIEKEQPIALIPENKKDENSLNINELQFNFEVLDNFYDTALVETIEGQNHGQSMDDMNYTTFDSLVLN